jgi:hypothetical protein
MLQEAMLSLLMRYSIGAVVFIISIGIWEVFSLKRFFDSKKVT